MIRILATERVFPAFSDLIVIIISYTSELRLRAFAYLYLLVFIILKIIKTVLFFISIKKDVNISPNDMLI